MPLRGRYWECHRETFTEDPSGLQGRAGVVLLMAEVILLLALHLFAELDPHPVKQLRELRSLLYKPDDSSLISWI